MFDPETAALLRAVLNELCENVPQLESSTRTRVASKILEAAATGEWSIDDLKEAGREALHEAPTMWR
jgi:hypothetical protein